MLKKQVAVLLIITLILTSLSSCTLFKAVKIENGMPFASGFENSETINQELTEFYGSIENTLTEFCVDAEIVLSSEKTNRGFVISSHIERNGVTIDIPEFTITNDGAVKEPEKTAFLRDGEFIDSALRLKELGMEIDATKYTQQVTFAQMYQTLLGYYDIFDVSDGLPENLTDDERLLKLKISNYEGESEEEYIANDYSVNTLMPNFVNSLFTNVYGYSSRAASYDEIFEMCELFLDVRSLSRPELAPVAEQFIGDAKAYRQDNGTLDESASRMGVAEAFVSAYEAQYGEIDPDEIYVEINDMETELDELTAKKAICNGMMREFPSGYMFSGEYTVHDGEIAGIASDLEFALFTTVYTEETDNSEMTYSKLTKIVGMIDKYLSNLERCTDPPVIVDNGGDNDWFLTQMDDSEYASVNCMPTIASMGIKWYNEDSDVTPAKLRKEYGYASASDGGWYMFQVEDCLNGYDVPFTIVEDISPTAMVEALDRGSIILSQMSEAQIGESGHCFVIYGYKKLGESLIFYVNDPQDAESKGKRIDSAYVYFIVNRFTNNFIEINK